MTAATAMATTAPASARAYRRRDPFLAPLVIDPLLVWESMYDALYAGGGHTPATRPGRVPRATLAARLWRRSLGRLVLAPKRRFVMAL